MVRGVELTSSVFKAPPLFAYSWTVRCNKRFAVIFVGGSLQNNPDINSQA